MIFESTDGNGEGEIEAWSRSVKFEISTAIFLYVLEKTILHSLSNFGAIWSAPAKVRGKVDFDGAWLMIHHDVIFFWKEEMKIQDSFYVWNLVIYTWEVPGLRHPWFKITKIFASKLVTPYSQPFERFNPAI